MTQAKKPVRRRRKVEAEPVSPPEPLQTAEEKEEERKQKIRDERYLPVMKVGSNPSVKGPVTTVKTVGLGKLEVVTHGRYPNL